MNARGKALRRQALTASLAVASGVVLAAAFPVAFPSMQGRELDPAGHLGWLAWVGLVPLFAALARARTCRGAAAAGFFGGATFLLLLTWWLPRGAEAFGLAAVSRASPLALWFACAAGVGAQWAIAAAAAFLARSRLGWPSWGYLPFAWAALEFARDGLRIGLPWGHLGYSQARHGVVAQLASAGGVYALSALVVFVNGVLFEVMRAFGARAPAPRRLLAAAAVLVAAVLAFGVVRQRTLRDELDAAPTVRIGVVQVNLSQREKSAGQGRAAFILSRLLPATFEADRRGADLVVWPEGAYPQALPADLEAFGDLFFWPKERLVRAHLLVGASTFALAGAGAAAPLTTGNDAFLLGPGYEVRGRYAKRRPVPFGEYLPLASILGPLRGPAPPPTEAGAAPEALRFELASAPTRDAVSFATLICSDALFPALSLAYASSAPELLVNPTNDAWSGYTSMPHQFLDFARLRAIELGRAVVRASYSGVSAVVLPTGELAPGALGVGSLEGGATADPELLVADVPRLRDLTIYARLRDVFAWASAVFAAALAGATVLSPRLRRDR